MAYRLRSVHAWILACLLPPVAFADLAVQTSPPEIAVLACRGCHGDEENPRGHFIPKISNQSKAVFVASMQAFRDGRRIATVMGRIAKPFSDQELSALGEALKLR